MRADDPFAGLDSIGWAALTHAYGPATDTPDLLRGLASDDAETVAEAKYELAGSILHQGSVYTATVAAVPFLARLAASGVQTVSVLELLCGIADSSDSRALEPADAARQAVAAQGGLLLPLLSAGDSEVRSMAGWVLALSRDASRFPAALVERWHVETDGEVRAGLLHGLHVLSPEHARSFAREALDTGHPARVRMIATYVLTDSGAPWSAEMDAAAGLWLADDSATKHRPWEVRFSDLVQAVLRAHDPTAAVALVAPALDVNAAVSDETRLRGINAAQMLVGRSRRATPLLVPLLTRLVGVDGTGESGEGGLVSERAADVLRLVGLSPTPLAADTVFAPNPEAPDERTVPQLIEALAAAAVPSRTVPALAARVRLANALARHDAEPEAVVAVYAEALTWAEREFAAGTWTVIDAINGAAHLGAASRPLVPALIRLLDAPDFCAASAQALRAIEPAEFDTVAGQRLLAGKLVAAINGGSFFMHQRPPVDALARLAPEVIAGDVRRRLAELADRDERLVTRGISVSTIREDEELRGLIEDLLTRTEPTHSPTAS